MVDESTMSSQHKVWEDWAQADPLWAILSDPSRKGGRWDLEEFFASREVREVLAGSSGGEHWDGLHHFVVKAER